MSDASSTHIQQDNLDYKRKQNLFCTSATLAQLVARKTVRQKSASTAEHYSQKNWGGHRCRCCYQDVRQPDPDLLPFFMMGEEEKLSFCTQKSVTSPTAGNKNVQ